MRHVAEQGGAVCHINPTKKKKAEAAAAQEAVRKTQDEDEVFVVSVVWCL